MPDIKHLISIDARGEQVFELVSSAEGMQKWWAADAALDQSGTIELGFFNRSTIYRLEPMHIASPTEAIWSSLAGKEWAGTRLFFRLTSVGEQTTLQFTHSNWEDETEYFTMCNTTWGELMYRLKATAEGKNPGPLFTETGLS